MLAGFETIDPGCTERLGWGIDPVRGRAMAFSIEFSPEARDHLRSLRRRDQQVILDTIAAQLVHQPDQPTTNRKLLDDNPLAP